ncbi:MAG TPA: hypothetical protein VJT49_13925 [Amycolatopsis sp.]|uniref:hypothetical protein n=1 Tax=Amycolatopsis sp. TaxID=37632 RepID=UPI002B49124E|nr:hypothetical protein [Amycolatopsis sp.]HKS46181.1 hypothetical protein [Amycolatopsis sp.]
MTDRPRASELFLAHLNAVADTDVTVLLRCATASDATRVRDALARGGSASPVSSIGERGRAIERARRAPVRLGRLELDGDPVRIGPFDVVTAGSTVVVRWCHLAGDARSCQEVVLDCLATVGPVCQCVRFGAKPLTPADAWPLVRGDSGLLDVARTGGAAVAPMLGPATRLVATSATGDDQDAFAVVRWCAAPVPGVSRFAQVTGTVAGAAAARSPVRVGVTVDLRRHEPLLARTGSAGNLSLVGWIKTGDTAIRRLVAQRFWRQQLAFDAWLSRPATAWLAARSDAVLGRLARRAPVTVTELWRDDAPTCESCGLARGRLPAGVSPVVIPPALPPAGLTVGITRTDDELLVVLRRMTEPGTSASGWLDALVARLPAEPVPLGGPIRYR